MSIKIDVMYFILSIENKLIEKNIKNLSEFNWIWPD